MRRPAASSRASYRLLRMSPVQQLRAPRRARRSSQLLVGLFGYGFSMAMMVQADLGLDPWDVLHQGLSHYLPLSFGQVTMVVGAAVLLAWIPLRQWPGLGTVANVVVIGLAADLGLWLLPEVHQLGLRIPLMLGSVVLNGLSGALYIGALFGPGPRDGLMTGIVGRFGGRRWASIRIVRTLIEVTVLACGWLLGGTVGIGTVLYALGIGPLVQFFLPRVAVRLPDPDDAPARSLPPVLVGQRHEFGGRRGEAEARSQGRPGRPGE